MIIKFNKVSDLVGLTLDSAMSDGDSMTFKAGDRTFKFYHNQDCCESVSIDDINGDLQDLVDSPLLIAKEVSSEDEPKRVKNSDDSFTWTFYRFQTIKGCVFVKWYGSSNGYYSEGVTFEEI